MSCPFQIGDRIHELTTVFVMPEQPMSGKANCFRTDLDPARPDATVIAITEDGFKYEYDTPIPHGRAEWGIMCVGGTCFPESYAYWRKIST